MSLLMPSAICKNVTDITVKFLKENKIECILLDVDNTLAYQGSQEPFEGAVEWTHEIRSCGINIVIVSNNLKKRVEPFSRKFDLPFVYLSLKPLPFGFNRAKKILKSDRENILVVGDQIFTDILGANLASMKSILLDTDSSNDSFGLKIRRVFERPIKKRMYKSKKIIS